MTAENSHDSSFPRVWKTYQWYDQDCSRVLCETLKQKHFYSRDWTTKNYIFNFLILSLHDVFSNHTAYVQLLANFAYYAREHCFFPHDVVAIFLAKTKPPDLDLQHTSLHCEHACREFSSTSVYHEKL